MTRRREKERVRKERGKERRMQRNCGRVHACRICLDPSHTTFQHPPEEKKAAPAASWLWWEETPVSQTRVLRVLYLFAGTDRKTSVRSVLERFSKFYSEGFTIECEEWDICRGPHQDLLEEKTQKDLLARIARGEFTAIILSPPCASWSRAPWANRWGPRPLRTVLHPWGMPWLEGAKLEKVAKSNGMIQFCIQVIVLVVPLPATSFLLEHPEDLGSVSSRPSVTVRPASIWQLPELRALAVGPVYTIVFYQCAMGAGSRKPTRFLPKLDRLARYAGPLPAQCACGRSHSGLIKRSADDAFSTTVAAAYPPQLDMFIAWAIWKFAAAQSFGPASPAGGVQQMQGQKTEEEGAQSSEGIELLRGEEGGKRQETEQKRSSQRRRECKTRSFRGSPSLRERNWGSDRISQRAAFAEEGQRDIGEEKLQKRRGASSSGSGRRSADADVPPALRRWRVAVGSWRGLP